MIAMNCENGEGNVDNFIGEVVVELFSVERNLDTDLFVAEDGASKNV